MSNKATIVPSNLPELLEKRTELQHSLLEKTQNLRDIQQTVEATGGELESLDAEIRAIESHQVEQERLSQLDAAGKEARAIGDRINEATQLILREYPRLAQLLQSLPARSISFPYDSQTNFGRLPIVFHDSQRVEVHRLDALEGGDRVALRAKYPAIVAQFSKK